MYPRGLSPGIAKQKGFEELPKMATEKCAFKIQRPA
jgi:hypothetical protein